jgi:4-hydroxy-tetrahydrodipicolinate synthase
MIDFGSIATAMVTPFDKKGNIDFEKTTTLVNYLIENGTTSIVVVGTTGESPTLTTEEKVALFRHVVKVVDKRVPVIAGTGSNDTRASISLTKKAEAVGVDAVLLVVPYYNKPNQEGIYQHFAAIAKETTLPVMVYTVPGRTVAGMTVDTVVRLSKIDNIVAIKDASGDLVSMTNIIANTSDDFALYSGDDGITLPVLAIGGRGVVSVASHIIGNEMQEMMTAFNDGDLKKAQTLNGKLVPIMTALFMAPSPTPVKTALQFKGLDVGSVRLPLVPLTESERLHLSEVLSK